MNLSKEGLAELASFECICLKPYLDSGGEKTVGIGATRSDIPDLAMWSWDREISIEQAVELYKKGLQKYVAAVNKAITKLEVSQTLFDALVSICFNIGVSGMAKSTFIKKVNADAPLREIVAAMAMWNKDNGKVVQGLINRRKKEADLILTGEYSSGGKVPLVPVVGRKPVYRQGKLINLMEYL